MDDIVVDVVASDGISGGAVVGIGIVNGRVDEVRR
jgi:hypothetical protein